MVSVNSCNRLFISEARITEDTLKLENVPYNDSAVPDDNTDSPRPCCKDQARSK